MEPSRDMWTGTPDYWQDGFIQEHLLLLGHAAWSGHLEYGQGILVCQLCEPVPSWFCWQRDRVSYTLNFKPQEQMSPFLHDLRREYDAEREFLLLIQGNGITELLLIRPKILPHECFRQVEQRYGEFVIGDVEREEKSHA